MVAVWGFSIAVTMWMSTALARPQFSGEDRTSFAWQFRVHFLSCQTKADRPLLTFEAPCSNNQVRELRRVSSPPCTIASREKEGRKDGHGPQATFDASSEWRRSGGYRLCVCLWRYSNRGLLASTESKLHMSNLMFGCQTHWGLNAKFWIRFMLCPLSECR
jgi:hypothetical protein